LSSHWTKSFTSCARERAPTNKRVVGVDHDQVLYAEGEEQALVGAQVAAARVLDLHVAAQHVAEASFSPASHSEDQEPTSLQPKSASTTAPAEVLSITA
jgi:hypothetical protein